MFQINTFSKCYQIFEGHHGENYYGSHGRYHTQTARDDSKLWSTLTKSKASGLKLECSTPKLQKQTSTNK